MIKITDTNADRIDAAIRKAEGKARERCANYLDCERAVSLALDHPVMRLLTQREATGVEVTYQGDSRVANAYTYTPMVTSITIKRRASGWFFVSAKRVQGNRSERISVTVDQGHLDIAARKLRESVAVRKDATA